MTAHAVLLNGASSSGKSGIAGWLQNLAPEPYFVTGFDAAMQALPFKMNRISSDTDPDVGHPWTEWVMSTTQPGIAELRIGEQARAALASMHRYAADLVRGGINVVIDDVFVDARIAEDARRALADVPVWLIGVRCPLDVLVEREATRGDRMLGLATWLFDRVHVHGAYDLDVDTSTMTAQQGAEAILDLIASNPQRSGSGYVT